jgi:hypothetical protein
MRTRCYAVPFLESINVKNLSILCVALSVGFGTPVAFAPVRGMGGHHSASLGIPVTGGASGERVSAPGTNSLGTALSGGSYGSHPQKGPLLGTSPAVDREEALVAKALGSVCRGC